MNRFAQVYLINAWQAYSARIARGTSAGIMVENIIYFDLLGRAWASCWKLN